MKIITLLKIALKAIKELSEQQKAPKYLVKEFETKIENLNKNQYEK